VALTHERLRLGALSAGEHKEVKVWKEHRRGWGPQGNRKVAMPHQKKNRKKPGAQSTQWAQKEARGPQKGVGPPRLQCSTE